MLHTAHVGSKREGHIYIEARTEKAVTDATDGLRGVLRSRPMVRTLSQIASLPQRIIIDKTQRGVGSA